MSARAGEEAEMGRTTIFALGYQGWGRATRELVKAIDAVERERGYSPPIFVDIRASRSARAKGFSGTAFEKLVGKRRYRWMKELGNEKKPLGDRPPLGVAEPSAAGQLLDLALQAQKGGRRVILLSSCPFPKEGGRARCHRHTVETLLLREAKKRGESLEVVEWPGGEPDERRLRVAEDLLNAVTGGRSHVPVGKTFKKDLAGLPWGSVVTLEHGDHQVHRVAGPLSAGPEGWVLPVLWPREGEPKKRECQRRVRKLRRDLGLERRHTG